MLKADLLRKDSMKSILVTNIEWENPQRKRYVVILTRMDMHLGQPGDVYLDYIMKYGPVCKGTYMLEWIYLSMSFINIKK